MMKEVDQRKWAVRVWIAEDNDLEDFEVGVIQEIKKVGSNDDVNAGVQLDRMSDQKTRRYYVRKGTTIEADLVQELGETVTSAPRRAYFA